MSARKVKRQDRFDTIADLREAVCIETWIECDCCNKEKDAVDMDTDDAALFFYSKGWRVDKQGYAIGPKCARKK